MCCEDAAEKPVPGACALTICLGRNGAAIPARLATTSILAIGNQRQHLRGMLSFTYDSNTNSRAHLLLRRCCRT